MSRCFPYPPPGYSVNRDSHEALIKSIKLQKDKEKAKAERKKERKREKKEKKREKEANAKQNPIESSHGQKRKHDDEKSIKQEPKRVNLEGKSIQKNGGDVGEQLERSGITEEHEPPFCSQNPSNSSESSENSNRRRRREASPVSGIRTHGESGNVLRIRLPSLKRKESSAVACIEKLCTPLSKDSTAQQYLRTSHIHNHEEPCSTSIGTAREQGCSTSGEAKSFIFDSTRTSSIATSLVEEIQTVETPYKNLFDNWVPLPLQDVLTDDDDQEWLFHRKSQRSEVYKTASSDVLCAGGSTLWPQAQLLPEINIYALPYAVPF